MEVIKNGKKSVEYQTMAIGYCMLLMISNFRNAVSENS